MPQIIASNVSTALAVKLRRLFEASDRFLVFPVGLGFSYDSLDFMGDPTKSALSAQERVQCQQTFARYVNIVPEDRVVFAPDASHLLWDEMKSVLTQCTYAQSILTTAEELELTEATEFLTDESITPEGSKVPVPSEIQRRYYQYKNLWEEAHRKYEDEAQTVEYSTGPEGEELRKHWEASRKQELTDAQDSAWSDWTTLGAKLQVENYTQKKNRLEVKKYLDRYGQGLLSDLSLSEVTDLNGMGTGYYTTFYSPVDAFDPKLPWESVTMAKSEIAALASDAPAELKALFGADQGSGNVERVSLEYSNVTVVRPWFNQGFLQSRCWKLGDGSVVSDGQLPRHGRVPAYITSMICVRNVQIVRSQQANIQSVLVPMLSRSMTLDKMNFENRSAPTVIARPVPVVSAQPVPPVVRAATPRPTVIAAVAANRGSYLAAKAQGLTVRMADLKPAHAGPIDRAGRPLSAAMFRFNPAAVLHPMAPGTPGLPGPLVTDTFALEGVSVLALVCKRVPKSPDPDPTFKW